MAITQTTVRLRLRAGLMSVLGTVIGLTSLCVGQASAMHGGSCQDVSLPVSLAVGQPADQTLAGTLCTPTVWASGPHSVDILVHGATYNRVYWDWPQNPPAYSYVNSALQAGRATFAYDQLGSGVSSRPASTALTPTSVAYSMHQAVQWLRGTQGFTQVTSIGHSFGSITSIHEAATYHDVNRVVVTGLLHAFGPAAVTGVADFYPAALDPAFSGKISDLGYLTTVPGSRSDLFYDTNTANPGVIAYDEVHKDVVSATFFGLGLGEFGVPAGLNIASGITVPVLSISGQEDALTCGLTLDCTNAAAVQANETTYYTSAPSVSTATMPDTGHDLNLHPSASSAYAIINGWIQTH
ncbi:MAG TPA: alpha/beta hydrolase [Candidatus Saccharimonadales bacterium]|nr:alpha/beta hydrolase [Candidatus Saccharimonadales bacterium]